MTMVTVSEKGQITIPSAIRRQANLRPGSHVEVEMRDGEVVIRPLKSISEVGGIFREFALGKSEDMECIREYTMAEVARERVEKLAREASERDDT